MSEHTVNPNAPKPGAPNAARKLSCEDWEALLVDFLDGTLPPGELSSFQGHQQSCASCGEMFSQAAQGREWLNFLHVEPQVSPILVSRILAQTSGAANHIAAGVDTVPVSAVVLPAAPAAPFWKGAGLLNATRRMAQPRLMMTAAMAFFSITLTLNMAGIRLGAVHLSDLKPAAVSNNLNKQYHMASARVVRYYDNLRFVYEMEARVRELRRDADLENSVPAQPVNQQTPAGTPQDGHKNGGKSEGPSSPQPRPMLWGEKIVASLESFHAERDPVIGSVAAPTCQHSMEMTDSRAAGQPERGVA